MSHDTLFQDTLELFEKCLEKATDPDLPWHEMRAREELAERCQVFLLEYHNPEPRHD